MNDLEIKENMYLGALCRRGHDYQGTGCSVRYKNKGALKGGICILCNRENKRKNAKAKGGAGKRRGKNTRISAICPMCRAIHMVYMASGWAGNGIPRKYCPNCNGQRKRLIEGEINYGYTN